MTRPLSLVTVNPATDPRWAALLDLPAAGIFHSPPWQRAVCGAYGFTPAACVAIDAEGVSQAGVAYCEIRDGLGDRIISFPFSDVCEPLLRSPGAWPLLAAHLSERGLPVAMRCFHGSVPAADPNCVISKKARWHTLALGDSADALRQRFGETTRRGIAKAERLGVTVRPLEGQTGVDAFVKLHVRLRKRKYRLLAQPASFFAAIAEHFSAIGGWLPLGAFLGDRLLAATIYLRWGDTLYYKFNASDPESLEYRPNNLLVWTGIQIALAQGCRALDLGPSDDDQPGLIRFKREFGAAERELQFLRRTPSGCVPPADNSLRNALREMTSLLTRPEVPDEVTAEAGAQLYRFFV